MPPHDPEFINTYRWAASLARPTPATPASSSRCCATTSSSLPARPCSCPPATCTPTCRGAGVEVMASSDNVLRGGLTSKHVDLAALIEVLDFTDGKVPVIHPVLGPGGLR